MDIFTLVAMTLLISTDVFMRYILNSPIFWAEEIAVFMQIGMVFIGAAAVTRKGSHITIDLISSIAHNKVFLDIIKCVASFIGVAFGATYISYAYPYAIWGSTSGQVSASLGIPLWIPYSTVLVGSVLITLHYIVIFIRSLAVLGRKSEVKVA